MTRRRTQAGCIFSLLFALAAASGVAARTNRDRLTVEELFRGQLTQVVHNHYFLPMGDVGPPAHELSGVLQFSETAMTTSHEPGGAWGSGKNLFPELSVPIISDGGRLIPLTRGIILSGNQGGSFWNIIISPGRVWRESGDGAYSRASFPFTLTDNYIGQARNGVATFVFDSTVVSPAAIQITQETAPVDEYNRTDFCGSIPVVYEPEVFEEREHVIRALEVEANAKLPVRPWSELAEADASRDRFNGYVLPSDVSAAALLIDGALYMQSVETRNAGPHPYPEQMRHGVFSVTKTLGMGLAMFYVAQKYGEQVFHALITDYVPALDGHPGWAGVTFENVLDMASGTRGRDEGFDIYYFILARNEAAKISAISNLPDAPPRPGETFNYASTNTFVLSYALNRYVEARRGPQADYWQMLTEDVLEPMGIPNLPVARTIEDDGSLGTPVMGWGSYPTLGEAAKIAQLLHGEGAYQGRQLLHREKIRDALHRTSYPSYEAGSSRYLHSVWLFSGDAGPCDVQVPSMSGHGGNLVMFFPSGIIGIRFADANNYAVTPMVSAAERYRSSCR